MQLKNFISTILLLIFFVPVFGQENLIPLLKAKLQNRKATISSLLSDTAYMRLHPITEFREMIKQYAKSGTVQIVTVLEPGRHITVKGILENGKGEPLKDKLVYFYQTSHTGWYAADAPHVLMNEGDRRHARLFGYLKTGSDGSFEIETIQPHGYPNSDLPAHIHFEVQDVSNSLVTELLFDDDERLTGEIRNRSVRDNFIISKNTGTEKKPLYFYTVRTK